MITLEQHLDVHMHIETNDGWESCDCGWREEYGRKRQMDGEDVTVLTYAEHVADTWREARTVRTVEELAELATGTAILLPGSDSATVDHGPHGEWTGGETVVHFHGGQLPIGYVDGEWSPVPALVLWIPEDGAVQ